jgi:Carboxypeptidase regulatory-like domain
MGMPLNRRNLRPATLVALAAALAFVAGLTATVQAQGQGGGRQGAQQGGRGGGRGQGQARDNTQTPVGTASVSGGVSLEGSAAPVRRARVTLSGGGLRGGRSVITDDKGQFTFSALPAGRFTMTASKPGYVTIAYGAKAPGQPGTPIDLIDGQQITHADITLPKGSVVTGVVVDEVGDPAPLTQVRVMRYVMRTGEKTLQAAGAGTTDDRGMYRIFGLEPGDYVVSAVPRNMNLGDMRATMMAEVESLLQQAQAANAGGGGGGGGGGGRGGRGGGGNLGNLIGGRGQQLLDRASQLQQQLAEQDQQQTVAYAPVYYPGTTTASNAVTVTLGIGEVRSAVDFQLQLVPTAKVEGTVTSTEGTLPPGTQVSLIPADQGISMPNGFNRDTARVNADGRFLFSNVTPGQYSVQARAVVRDVDPNAAATGTAPGGRGAQGGRGGRFGGRGGFAGPGNIAEILWASTDVTVAGQNLSDVMLNLQKGMTVSGSVAFKGSLAPPTDLTRVRVTLTTRGQQTFNFGGNPPAVVDSTGHFKITGVAPGRYVLQGNAPVGDAQGGRGGFSGVGGSGSWILQSAIANGRDTLDFPLEVQPNEDVSGAVLTFTDQTQQLAGTLQDSSGRPTSDYTIIAFAADRQYWTPQSRRIQATRPDTSGRFTLRGLPAGSYRLTAVTDVETGEWYDPAFLDQVTGASIPFTLNPGEQKTQDIKVAGSGQSDPPDRF